MCPCRQSNLGHSNLRSYTLPTDPTHRAPHPLSPHPSTLILIYLSAEIQKLACWFLSPAGVGTPLTIVVYDYVCSCLRRIMIGLSTLPAFRKCRHFHINQRRTTNIWVQDQRQSSTETQIPYISLGTSQVKRLQILNFNVLTSSFNESRFWDIAIVVEHCALAPLTVQVTVSSSRPSTNLVCLGASLRCYCAFVADLLYQDI